MYYQKLQDDIETHIYMAPDEVFIFEILVYYMKTFMKSREIFGVMV